MVDLGSVLRENGWSSNGSALVKESSEFKLFIMDFYQKRGLKYKSSKIENSTSFVTLESSDLRVTLSSVVELVTGKMPPPPKDLITSCGYWSGLDKNCENFSYLNQVGPVRVSLFYNSSLPVNELRKYLPFRFLN